jgi:starch-binding outer membrane protein SusE/F
MKNIMKLTMGVVLLSTFIFSCKKEENQVLFEGGTAPVLTASTTADMILIRPNAANLAVAFDWTNPNYKFNTGVSSQDVTYTLQIDTTGSNFTNRQMGEKVIAKDLAVRLTVADLNNLVLGMNLVENIPHNLEIRIKSALVNSTVPLYSNVIKMVVTPYLDVVYPVPDNLYITGSATPLSWQCACATDGNGATQKFTKVSSSKFELTIVLSANNSYLLLPVWSSWARKYGGMGANNTNNVNGDGFKPEGGDIKSPATSGTYKIVVEFKTGKFTVTPQ